MLAGDSDQIAVVGGDSGYDSQPKPRHSLQVGDPVAGAYNRAVGSQYAAFSADSRRVAASSDAVNEVVVFGCVAPRLHASCPSPPRGHHTRSASACANVEWPVPPLSGQQRHPISSWPSASRARQQPA